MRPLEEDHGSNRPGAPTPGEDPASGGRWGAALLALALLLPSPSGSAGGEDGTSSSLVRAARTLCSRKTEYDRRYYPLEFPGGDPGLHRGACTDLVVRAYRAVGIDLQVRVHEDIRADFDGYPAGRRYGSRGPDPSIDHRRVANLAAFFRRHGLSLPIGGSEEGADWKPGDIVVWDVRGRGEEDHIGIVSDRKAPSGRPLVLHHFPPFPAEEDVLNRWRIVGHYRYPAD